MHSGRSDVDTRPGLLRRVAAFFRRRSPLVLLLIGVAGGIVFWGGFNTAMELSNEMSFCISCHEMRDTVYQEYRESVHFEILPASGHVRGLPRAARLGPQGDPQDSGHQ